MLRPVIRWVFILVVCFTGGTALGQQPLNAPSNKVSVSDTGNGKFYYSNRNEPPRAAEFRDQKVASSRFLSNINQYLNVPTEFTFVEQESNTDQLGMKHRLLQQYYKGIPVEGLTYRIHEKQGFVTSANGRAIREIKLDMQTVISEEQAFHLAMQSVNGKDSVIREGKRFIVSKNFTFTPESFALAYVFDIDVSLIEQWRISINARTGELINKVSLVNICGVENNSLSEKPTSPEIRASSWLPYTTGTGITSYYGRRTIRVEKFGTGNYSQLQGQTENGGFLKTYDFKNVSVMSLTWFWEFHEAYMFSSGTNTYDNDYLKPAVSVHWAAEQAYEYYYKKHNRNSYDNQGSPIVSYVHIDRNYNNAMWTHNLMAFGDGNNNNPPVELDVVSHELTHGVTQFEAGLQYYNEPGALNESFSDIMGKAVEFDLFGDTATWLMGKYFDVNGLRNFSNPNLKNQPDTYLGDLWYTGGDDAGGVHTNSGVQNHWFYLLSEGGTGVNDHFASYSITPIGIEAATKIAYRNLTEYLGRQSEYLDARIGSMLAAADLYGYNSTIYKEVDKAWDAVGVIDEPTITSLETFDITATTVKLKGTLVPRSNAVTYHFEYGTTPALGTSSSVYTYTNSVEGKLTGLQSQTKYYVHLVATNENGSTSYPIEFTTISLAPLVKIRETVDVTETTATLYGKINPNSLPTTYVFEYGTTPALGSVTQVYSLSDDTEYLSVSAPVSNLEPRKTYYYRLKATNGFSSAVTESESFFTSAKPAISSFAPATAPIDAVITITGLNFNPGKENSIVNFGATVGTILSSTETEIKVKVPAGASLSTISVLDVESGRVAESVAEFVPTFAGTFRKEDINLTVGVNEVYVWEAAVQDMDGDNKPDIVARHYLGFTVYQNVNQGGDITEQSFARNTFNSTDSPGSLGLIDIDGNGLKDVVVIYDNAIRIYPNLSVPGYVFFGAPVDIAALSTRHIVFSDFDLDGHIDIGTIGSVAGQTSLVVYRNQNPRGSISADNFPQQFVRPIGYDIWFLTCSDLNNDGRSDLVASVYGTNYVLTLKNNTSQGVIDFVEATTQDLTRGRFARYLTSDLNGDGWRDLVQHSPYEVGSAALFENSKTSQNIEFKKPIIALSGFTESMIRPGDFNGDGKIDLVVGTDKRELLFLANKETAGNPFSTATFETAATKGMKLEGDSRDVNTKLTINDLNGDGRPEIISVYGYNYGPHDGYVMEIWQNAPPNCADPSAVKINVEGTQARITLPPNTDLEDYEIAYKYDEYSYWTAVTEKLFRIWSGRKYQLRVRAKCYLDYTDYSYLEFVADCVELSSFQVTPGTNSAVLSSYVLGDIEIDYSPEGEDEWKSVPQNSTKISDLSPGSTYDIRLRGRCSSPSPYTYVKFTTLCPQLSTLYVSEIDYDQAKVNWSSNYNAVVYTEYSVDNISWIPIDGTKFMTALTPATKYYVRGRMDCNDLSSEFMYTSFTTICPKVLDLHVDAVTPFSATVSWTDRYNSGSFMLSYKLTNGGQTSTFPISGTSFKLTGLSPGGAYTVSVSPVCDYQPNYETITFSSLCYTPADLSATNIAHTTASLSWNSPYAGVPYVVEYSISGSGAWKVVKSTETHADLAKLRPGTLYEARVQIDCLSETAAYSSVTFETELYDETTYGPNPTPDKITLRPSKNLIGNRYVLSDNAGRIMLSGELLDYTIDLSHFSRGVYTLVIDGEPPIRIVKL